MANSPVWIAEERGFFKKNDIDVEAIVVGGSVALMGDVLFNPVRETIQKFAMPPYRDRQLLMAALGDDSGLLGAAALAAQE